MNAAKASPATLAAMKAPKGSAKSKSPTAGVPRFSGAAIGAVAGLAASGAAATVGAGAIGGLIGGISGLMAGFSAGATTGQAFWAPGRGVAQEPFGKTEAQLRQDVVSLSEGAQDIEKVEIATLEDGLMVGDHFLSIEM